MKKDIAYILVIITLLAVMYVQYTKYQEDSYSRTVACFEDVVEEVEWCEEFYRKHNERNGN
jgi:hypothetical protein